MKNFITKIVSAAAAVSLFAGAVPVMAQQESTYATREYVISEFVQSVGRSNLTGSNYILSKFADANEIDEKYTNDFEKAVTSGLVEGYEDNTLHPKDNITRVEALAIFSRCVPETDDVDAEPIAFTDVPEWAKSIIDGLSKVGLVEGYGDGRLGAMDNITVEQVKILTDRSDKILNTVEPSESFYGYVNNKSFRNYEQGSKYTVDALHGVIIPTENSWSAFGDISKTVMDRENEMLTKLVNGELEYENGTPEQRIYDMLHCIDKMNEDNAEDTELYNSYRKKIADAATLDEFFAAVNDIYKETGINTLFDIAMNLEPSTHAVYPQMGFASAGNGGLIAFNSTAKKAYSSKYLEVMKECLKYSGAEFSDADIKKAIEIQEAAAKGTNFMTQYALGTAVRQALDPDYSEEQAAADMEKLAAEHPEFDTDESTAEAFTIDEADKKVKAVKLSQVLTDAGFKDFDHIMMSTLGDVEACSAFLTQSNLNALKANALLLLASTLQISENDEEKAAYEDLLTITFAVVSGLDFDKAKALSASEETAAEEETPQEDISEADRLLSDSNLLILGQILPTDIGLMYCNQYYDDNISDVVAQMVRDIWDAYVKRFEKNGWMSDETKKNAIKKIENMVAVIGYPDNYNFPTITPVKDGGTYFKNILSIHKDELATTIRMCAEQDFLRTMMFMPSDEVNACYVSLLNSMNIPAGILNAPIYDPEASYAANLGSIGMVVAHEIGHAFDADGSQFDENGCLNNWWTDEDAKVYEEKKQGFVDYYKNFEVMDGVVQDSELTITENMADFAGIQCVFDIIGDDKDAQREALESFAKMWARIGSASIITSDHFLQDVHSTPQVRVNACVASLDCFYDLYDIKEGDPMYVAPENRLKLW